MRRTSIPERNYGQSSLVANCAPFDECVKFGPGDFRVYASTPIRNCERFGGHRVIGLPFASGHYLVLRRFAAASIGPAYTSVWWRDPSGAVDHLLHRDTLPQLCALRRTRRGGAP